MRPGAKRTSVLEGVVEASRRAKKVSRRVMAGMGLLVRM